MEARAPWELGATLAKLAAGMPRPPKKSIIPRNGEELLKFRDFYRTNLAEVSGGENLGIDPILNGRRKPD